MQAGNTEEAAAWGHEEFGSAELGNTLRVARLEAIAAGVAQNPGGKVTDVFASSADRQGAYKFLENPRVSSDAVAEAAHLACANRCGVSGAPFAYVPVDGSSLNITDAGKGKGLGPIGARSKNARGLQTMNAIAVLPDGTPAGICGQVFWSRDEKKSKMPARQRPFAEKESRHWLAAMQQVRSVFGRQGGECIPWFQCDRGGDFQELLLWAVQNEAMVTVRCNHDRRVDAPEALRIRALLETKQATGRYEIDVPAGPKRKARRAVMEVRHCDTPLILQDDRGQELTVPFSVVLTREVGTTPADEKPIEWLLLTTFAVTDFESACFVIHGYTQRWRVEEFHKAWKSSCKVEETQLQNADSIVLWATILASIAMRIERLKYLARAKPQTPASVEFDRDEIDTAILLSRSTEYSPGDDPPVARVVEWVARVGGYTGKSSGGPPGTIVLARGLQRLYWAIQGIRIARENPING